MSHSKKKTMQRIHLYPTELRLLDKMPADVRREFDASEESLDFTDSSEKLKTRLSLVRLHDPVLSNLRSKVQSGEDIVAAIKEVELQEVNEADLMELFFAMGPSLLTSIITALLAQAKTDGELLSVAALAEIRHSLLSASHA